jgi:hypothetical protein
LIMAHYLNFQFVDPSEAIFFGNDGMFDADLTNTILRSKLRQCKNAVIPRAPLICIGLSSLSSALVNIYVYSLYNGSPTRGTRPQC